MDNLRGLRRLEQCAESLQKLYQVAAENIVCDAHPEYTTTRWALRQGLPLQRVYHHHAHAAAAWLDGGPANPASDAMLVFAWDGVGLGPDGTLWGGEALLGRPGDWQRVGTLRSFRLPGGERASREPWRSAAGLCWEAGLECPFDEASDPLIRHFWRRGRNTPKTSAAGRLFDAASALCGLGTHATFEGQGPMQLEALAAGSGDSESITAAPLPLARQDGTCITDWAPLLPLLLDTGLTVRARARVFHETMAQTLLKLARQTRADTGVERVGFSGGVFQNRLLAERTLTLLREDGFEVCWSSMIPINDAGISCGQVIEFAHREG
jgi:hydrogenase maturation protein HypF